MTFFTSTIVIESITIIPCTFKYLNRFIDYFRKSAQFVRGHQIMARMCDFGAVTREGRPRFENLQEGFRFYANIGSMDLTEPQLDELEKRDFRDREKFFGI